MRTPLTLRPRSRAASSTEKRSFRAEPNAIKRDEIGGRQLHALRQHHTGKLRRASVRLWPHHWRRRERRMKS